MLHGHPHWGAWRKNGIYNFITSCLSFNMVGNFYNTILQNK